MVSATTWDAERASQRIQSLAHLPGAMLPILHALQEEFGYIDDAAIPLIAEALNVSKAEVVGVIHFYHDFRMAPPGQHTLRVCRAEACQAKGSDALVEHIQDQLQADIGDTTRDGVFSLEAVYCLGNCGLSPAVMLDGKTYGRVSPQRAEQLMREAVS